MAALKSLSAAACRQRNLVFLSSRNFYVAQDGKIPEYLRAQGEFISPISATLFAASAGSLEVNGGIKKSECRSLPPEKHSFSNSRNFYVAQD